MKTTLFGSKIIEAAEEVLSIGYRAGSRNCYGEKLEQVVKEFDLLQPAGKKYFTGSGKKQVDYCAITQGVILDRAFKKYNNSANAIRSASAKYFLDEANRRKIRVDKTPQPGCLFVTKRSGGSGYHVGMVWKLEGSGFRTIEGNTYSSSSYNIANGCKVKLGNTEYGILSRYRTKGNIHAFLHFEELFDKTLQEFPDSETYLADETDACLYREVLNVDDGNEGDKGTEALDYANMKAGGWFPEQDEHGNLIDLDGKILVTAEEVKSGCYYAIPQGKICPEPPATTTADTILGLPKEAVYIGGAVVGFAGLCWLAGRSKKSSALSDKPKRRRKRKTKTTTKAKKRRKRK